MGIKIKAVHEYAISWWLKHIKDNNEQFYKAYGKNVHVYFSLLCVQRLSSEITVLCIRPLGVMMMWWYLLIIFLIPFHYLLSQPLAVSPVILLALCICFWIITIFASSSSLKTDFLIIFALRFGCCIAWRISFVTLSRNRCSRIQELKRRRCGCRSGAKQRERGG